MSILRKVLNSEQESRINDSIATLTAQLRYTTDIIYESDREFVDIVNSILLTIPQKYNLKPEVEDIALTDTKKMFVAKLLAFFIINSNIMTINASGKLLFFLFSCYGNDTNFELNKLKKLNFIFSQITSINDAQKDIYKQDILSLYFQEFLSTVGINSMTLVSSFYTTMLNFYYKSALKDVLGDSFSDVNGNLLQSILTNFYNMRLELFRNYLTLKINEYNNFKQPQIIPDVINIIFSDQQGTFTSITEAEFDLMVDDFNTKLADIWNNSFETIVTKDAIRKLIEPIPNINVGFVTNQIYKALEESFYL